MLTAFGTHTGRDAVLVGVTAAAGGGLATWALFIGALRFGTATPGQATNWMSAGAGLVGGSASPARPCQAAPAVGGRTHYGNRRPTEHCSPKVQESTSGRDPTHGGKRVGGPDRGPSPDDLVFTTPRGQPLRNLNWRRDVR